MKFVLISVRFAAGILDGNEELFEGRLGVSQFDGPLDVKAKAAIMLEQMALQLREQVMAGDIRGWHKKPLTA